MAEKGHWYTDKNGNHYFVKEGETPKEGWEASKRRKMIDGGKYKVDEGDGKGSREVSREEWDKYEADDDFDATTDDDFGFDEEEDNVAGYQADFDKKQRERQRFLKESGLDKKYELDSDGYLVDKAGKGEAVFNFDEINDDFDEAMNQISFYERMNGKEEVDVPYHEGAKGKIVDQKGDVATIEYTGENGITRRDQFHKDEIKRGSPDADSGEGLVDFRGKQKFLEKYGLDKAYYWDGADLVDAEDNSTTSVALPNAGIQEKDLLQQIKDLRKTPGDSGIDEKKLDHITDYFKAWGNPGEYEWDEVSKFYNLSPREGEELRKRLGMGSPDKMKVEFPDDKEKEPHYIGNDGNRYDSSSDYWQSKKEEEKEAAKTEYKPDREFEDYGSLGKEHDRLFEEFASIDGEYRKADAELDDKRRNGQISNDKWWDEKSKLEDHYTGLKKNKKAEMDSVYAKLKAIDDEKNRRTEEAANTAEEKSIQDFLSANNIAPDSPIAKGLTRENRKFILELLKNRKK